MTSFKSFIYVFVAVVSVAMAACQPAEGPAERAGKSIDGAAAKASEQIDRAVDKVKDATN